MHVFLFLDLVVAVRQETLRASPESVTPGDLVAHTVACGASHAVASPPNAHRASSEAEQDEGNKRHPERCMLNDQGEVKGMGSVRAVVGYEWEIFSKHQYRQLILAHLELCWCAH